MAHINLLPWRAERRKQREREFYGKLGLAGAAGLLVVIVWAFSMGQRIDNQNARNDYLKGQIKQVQVKIDKIKDLEKMRQQLLDRKRIIEKLQSNRSQMVHLFDVLVKTIPDSVRLTSLRQNKQHLDLVGVAQSNASVAEYMKKLEASPWLSGTPTLKKTVNHHDRSRMPYTFYLGVNLSKPSDAERQAAESEKAAKQAKGATDDKPAATATLPAAAGSAAKQGGAINVTAPAVPSQDKAKDANVKPGTAKTGTGAVTLPLAGSDKGAKS